jgi:hypothetical protein
MFDFNDLFSVQLANEKPFTAGMVNSTLHLMAHSMKPREIMAKSKELKAKIGKRRLLYYVTGVLPDGKPAKQKMNKVWEDDFMALQDLLADYVYVSHEGRIPCFAHKDIK